MQDAGFVLATPRLELSSFTEADVCAEYLGWLTNPVVTRFSNQRFRRHDADSARRFLAGFAGSSNLFLAIRWKEQRRMVGTMTAYVMPQHQTADIGLMIGDTSCWGKGLGLEAWSALMGHLFERGLRKSTGGTVRPNVAMQRIMERSGMRLEAVRERQEIIEGKEEDILYFARFRHE